MNYPCFMYTTPGLFKCKGATYSYELVENDEEALVCAENGYYPTLLLALAKPEDFDIKEYLGISKEPPKEPTKELPSREQLEKTAKEYDIKFTKKTTDQTLYDLIDQAIKEMTS